MRHTTKLAVGQVYYSMGMRLKILAIADNYVMAKFSRCIPFVQSVKEFEARNLDLVEKNKK